MARTLLEHIPKVQACLRPPANRSQGMSRAAACFGALVVFLKLAGACAPVTHGSLVCRLRGGGGRWSTETRREMNERWRAEARARKNSAAEAAARTSSDGGGTASASAPVLVSPATDAPVATRRDPAAGVLVEEDGVTAAIPRAQMLARLCERQKCSALDPSLYDFGAIGQDASKYSSLSDYIEWTRHRKTSDEDVGITEFVTSAPGVGGLLKARWADFYVQEIRLRDRSRVCLTDTVTMPPRPWPLAMELDQLDVGFHALSPVIGVDAARKLASFAVSAGARARAGECTCMHTCVRPRE